MPQGFHRPTLAIVTGCCLCNKLSHNLGAGSAAACSAVVHASNGNKFVSLVSIDALPTQPGLNFGTFMAIFRFLFSNVSFQITTRMRHIRTKFVAGIMDREVSKALYEDFLPRALVDGSYVAAPEPIIVGKGLDHIQAGLDTQRKGVSAKKIVIAL